MAQHWGSDRAELEVTAASLADAVREVAAARAEAVAIGADAAARATADLHRSSRTRRTAASARPPKFPEEPELLFLLDQARARTASADGARVAERALDGMARGGIFDQVGGGFHRYSTDAAWQVPHFEKMLYNQAQLARAYLAGYRVTGRLSFRRAAEQTLDYVLREMTSPEGGFYSATDADSDGAEGRFFVWTGRELERGARRRRRGLGREGVRRHRRRQLRGRPHRSSSAATARRRGARIGRSRSPRRSSALDRVRDRLRAARAKRNPPLRDDKVLTAWNGMMITALAEGYADARPRTLARRRRARRRPAVVDGAARAGPAVASAARRRRRRSRALLEDHACSRRGAARALRRDR